MRTIQTLPALPLGSLRKRQNTTTHNLEDVYKFRLHVGLNRALLNSVITLELLKLASIKICNVSQDVCMKYVFLIYFLSFLASSEN
jgi:hypothetical protein